MAKQRASYYFRKNFWITTSGHFHTPALMNTIEEIGEERVMFSVDHPFEQIDTAARWFDELSLEKETKIRIGRENARKLLSLPLESA